MNEAERNKHHPDLPERLVQAQHLRQLLADMGVYFAPIRHHSPACALAVQAQLTQLQPERVLIEAPADAVHLLGTLLDSRCVPPVALLCQAVVDVPHDIFDTIDQSQDVPNPSANNDTADGATGDPHPTPSPASSAVVRTAFFPFCDYSPEWVALRVGRDLGAQLDLIDLPWSEQVAHEIQVDNQPIPSQPWTESAELTPSALTEHIEDENPNGDHTIDDETNAASESEAEDQVKSPTAHPFNPPDAAASRTLQAERYLAHSQYIQALAKKAHCRDHDELWDHLFELRSHAQLTNWQNLFEDTFIWSSMARLDYESSVLEAEGSMIREQHMVGRILAHYDTLTQESSCAEDTNHSTVAKRCKTTRPVMVIVTGGFHTLALIESLAWQLLPAQPDGHANTPNQTQTQTQSYTQPQDQTRKQLSATSDQWLIRYSFDRLDALNGYSSGMPSPAYHQRIWQALLQHPAHAHPPHAVAPPEPRNAVALNILSQLAALTREEQLPDAVGFATVQNAAAFVHGLANLRRHQVIGRYDLLDAIDSCYIKGSRFDGQVALDKLIFKLFSGHALGDVPPHTQAPPLLANTRRSAQQHRLKLDDTLRRRARLDVYRKPAHRERSRFLHLMAFLSCEFCQRIAGPDYLNGVNLDVLFEEWDYAWSPAVEARLIEWSSHGSDLRDIAQAQILEQEQQLEAQGHARDAQQAVKLLTQAAVIGLQQRLPQLLAVLLVHVQEDKRIGSVAGCGLQLLHLWRGREFLGLINTTQHRHAPSGGRSEPMPDEIEVQLLQLISKIIPTALFLLPSLRAVGQKEAPVAVSALLDLREFCHLIQNIAQNLEPNLPQNLQQNASQIRLTLEGFAEQKTAWQTALIQLEANASVDGQTLQPLLQGALAGLLYLESLLDDGQFETRMAQHFGVGAEPRAGVLYLTGIMQVAPELLVQHSGLIQAFSRVLQHWPEETFVAYLPDLRYAFTQLKPQETARVADQVAQIHHLSAHSLQRVHTDVSADDLQQGAALHLALIESLREDGLENWL